jgi:UDP-perosamine 4-acetyltransferase
MIFVPVPKESVSDDSVLLVQWLVADRAAVSRGATIAVIETSKATLEVSAPADGFLGHLAAAGQRVAVGANLAVIAASPPAGQTRLVPAPAAKPDDARFSKAALELMTTHGLARDLFAHLQLVRRQDVEEVLRRRQGAPPALIEGLRDPGPNDVVIWGAGGHAKVCIEIIRAVGELGIYGIVDANVPPGTRVLDVPVIGHESALEVLPARGLTAAVLGIGAVTAHGSRREMFRRLRAAGYRLPNLIHPRTAVDASTKWGDGNVVFAHATVSADVTVGAGCIINSGAVVSHDCVLADNVHLAPGALLAGNVHVGANTLIGMGTQIFLGVRVGENVRVNNGAIVNGDVPDNAVVKT